MNDTNRQPTCAERVKQAWQSRRDDLSAMLDPENAELQLTKTSEGTTRASVGEFWMSAEDIETQRFNNPQEIFDEYADEIKEAASEAFNEYGLAFDYVAPGTFSDQNEGYWRYQISWGGPSEEIRFFASPGPNTGDFTIYRAEFWHLDWFDGAPVDVTHDPITCLLWDEFHDTGTVDAVMREALD